VIIVNTFVSGSAVTLLLGNADNNYIWPGVSLNDASD